MPDFETLTVKIKGDASSLMRTLTASQAAATAWGRKIEGTSKNVSRSFDNATKSLRTLSKEMQAFQKAAGATGGKVSVSVEAQGTQETVSELKAVDSAVSDVDGERATVEVEASGSQSTIAELKAVDRAVSDVDGESVKVDVDRSSISSLHALETGLGSVASSMRNFKTVASTVVGVPALLAGIGGLVPVALGAAGAVTQLAIVISSGLVGAAAAGAGAMGILGGAIAAAAAPIAMTIADITEYKEGLAGAEAAQKAAASASQAYADAQDRVAQAQANVAKTREQGQEAITEAEEAVTRAHAESAAGVEAAEDSLAETRTSVALSIADAEDNLADVRRDADESVARAEDDLIDARETLRTATESLTAAQRELNYALEDEPLNQKEATLELADARDRASDAQRAYNEAVKEHGRNSEEATDAERDLTRANLELRQQELETQRTRKDGSDELQAARAGVKSAYDSQRDAAEGVRTAEIGLKKAQDDRTRAVAEAQATLTRAHEQGAADIAKAAAAVTKAEVQGAQQVEDAEDALADTRETHTEQMQAAQAAVTEAQTAAARAAKAAREAQAKAKEETVSLTAAQHALLRAWEQFSAAADKAFGPAKDAAARLGVEVLRLAEDYLPRLGLTSLRVMQGLSRSFDNLKAKLAGPVEQSGIETFLTAVERNAEKAATAAGELGLALFNVFVKTIPYGEELIDITAENISLFHDWTRSASGQTALERFFANMWHRAEQLGEALGNIGVGLGKIFQGLTQGGQLDAAAESFIKFSEAFRQGINPDRITNFMTNMRPAMGELGELAGEAAHQFFVLADNIAKAGQKGGKKGTLAEVIEGITESMRPLRRMVQDAFVVLGPLIAELIPEVAEFMRTFFGENSAVATFVEGLTTILRKFNNLPEPIKNAVSEMTGWYLLMRLLGGPSLGTLGNLLGLRLALGGITKGAKKGASPVGKLATKFGALRLAVAGGVIGIAIAGIAVVLGGAVIASDDLRKALGKLGGTIMEIIVPGAKDAGDALKNLGDRIGSFFKRIGDEIAPGVEAFNKALRKIFDLDKKDTRSAANEAGYSLGRALINGIQKFFTSDFSLDFTGLWGGSKASGNKAGKDAGDGFVGGLARGIREEVDRVNWSDVWRGIFKMPSVNVKDSPVGRLIRDIKNAFQNLDNWATRAIWDLVKNTFFKPWEWLYNKLVGGSVIPDLRKRIVQIITGIPGALAGSLKQTVKNMLDRWDDIRKGVTDRADTTRKNVLDKIDTMRKRAGDFMERMRKGAHDRFDEIRKGLTDSTDTTRKNVVARIDTMRERSGELLSDMRDGAHSRAEELKEGVRNRIDDMRSNVLNLVDKMRSGLAGLWERITNAARTFGDGFKNIIGDAIREGVEKARNWLGELALGLANLLGKLHLPGEDSLRDVGNNLQGPMKFARGGTYNADRGGVAGPGRLGIVGEAGEREAIVNLERRTPESRRAARAVLTSPNAPRMHRDPETVAYRYAEGGLVGRTHETGVGAGIFGSTANHLWTDDTFGRVLEVLKRFRVSANTYSNHPPGNPSMAGKSADFWDYAGRGTPISLSLNNAVRSFIESKLNRGLDYTLGEGQGGHSGGERHVHATWNGPDPTTPNVPYTGHVGGGATGGIGNMLGSMVSAMLSKLSPFPDSGFMALFSGLEDTVLGWVQDWVGSMGGDSGVGTFSGDWATAKGGSPSTNKAIGKKGVTEVFGAGQWPALEELWTRESGWDRFAENPSSGAYGIPQALPPSKMPAKAQKSGGSYAGYQIGWGLNYIKSRPDQRDPKGALAFHNSHGWYARGGIIPGSKGKPVLIQAHSGERVLPVEVTQAFDRLANTIQRWSKSGPGRTGAPRLDGNRLADKKLDDIRDRLDKQLDKMATKEELADISVRVNAAFSMSDGADTIDELRQVRRIRRLRELTGV